jgi:putative radical SAM enzyme (TIGR03279 family)
MALFRELEDFTQAVGGLVTAVVPGSVAEEIGLQPGDELLAINDQAVQDVIDVQFYSAEDELELLIRREGEYLLYEAYREYGQALGLEFAHPTFDTDIRRCNNLCEFCFVLQMAPRFRRTLYIKDDDYRYSFLFGHFVTLTNLNEHDWWRIETMGLSPLYISVHVTDWEKRRDFLRNKTAPDIMEQLRWLAERGIEMHTQLVVVPEFNDGDYLRRSIEELAALWPAVQSISVVPVGLTEHHKYRMRTHTPEEAAETLAYVESLQPLYQAQFGVRFVYPTDEWYLVTGRTVPPLEAYDDQALHENGLGMVRYFLDEWAEVQGEIRAWLAEHGAVPTKRLLLGTGLLFAETLQETTAVFNTLTGIQAIVQPIHNHRLGGTITTAGLLMAEDIINQLRPNVADIDLIILPRIIFDHPDRISLDDRTPAEIATQLNRPVALADTMGDVWDALLGVSAALHYPIT